MKLWLAKMQQAGDAFWSQRDARERKLLALATFFVITVLLYLFFIAPALNGRERLSKNLPELHEQVAQMQALSAQATSLSANMPTHIAAMTKDTLSAALTAHGIKTDSINMQGEAAQIQLSNVSFADTMSSLDELQKSARISVTNAKISALAKPDRIDATFTLHQAQP